MIKKLSSKRVGKLALGAALLGIFGCSESGLTPTGPVTPVTNAAKRNLTLTTAPGFTAPTGLWLDIQGGKIDSVTVASTSSGLIINRLSAPAPNGGGQFVLVRAGGVPTGVVSAVLWGPAGDGYSVRVVEAAAADFSLVDPSPLVLQLSN